MTQEIRLRPDQIIADPAKNYSRSGKEHDPDHIAWLAEQFLTIGQLASIKVLQIDGEKYELVYGFARHTAGSKLVAENKTSPTWNGELRTIVVSSLSVEEREDQNIAENLGASLSPIDVALLARRFTLQPDEGGRGYSLHTTAMKLKRQVPELRRLMTLTQLIEPLREQIRRNHRNPEIGITVEQGLKLARREVAEQEKIFAASRDAGGGVTPKAVRGTIAPHQGRQGQPSGATGLVLDKLSESFGELAKDKDARTRCGFKSAEQVETVQAILDLLKTGSTTRKIPDSLRRLVTAAQERKAPDPKAPKLPPPTPEELAKQAAAKKAAEEKPAE